MLHLRDLPIPDLFRLLHDAGIAPQHARVLVPAIHRHGARTWEELKLKDGKRARLEARARFGPLLQHAGSRTAPDGTRKDLYRLASGDVVETVRIQNLKSPSLCVSSQAGCALDCSFCATGRLGLRAHMTPGEITESVLLQPEPVHDVVFMGQGEPLHNYDAVMTACANLEHDLGPCLSRKKITISTVGLIPQIERYTREGRRWRLHLSLHSAIQQTREQLIPAARANPLPDLMAAMEAFQQSAGWPWITLQYVAIPGVNMDGEHVDALVDLLAPMRVILNVIPWNETGTGYRAPEWSEVKEFTTKLRRIGCPVKIRYSGGKQEGMGCGQLSGEAVETPASGGHLCAPPGNFTG
ncbi:MAG: 23S rRNA (adenine(2503)-C(2))-methyltransferase RlmN [Planctomycetota bacterium]|jgi:23S rRNA (adenine2503-C2)-methyltransferase